MTRLWRILVAALLVTLTALALAPPSGADQCAPPGADSASALPTNLAAAAGGPGSDRYTTPGVVPLDRIDRNALGLGTPGTLTVGTLSDAPPSICINSAGQFTGFDNELLRAIADKLGLKITFVGTEFSGLLAQVAARRFDVGSSSITTTDARRRTVGFTNGYDFGYFSLVVPSGSPITGFDKLGPGQRIGVVQGTVQESYVIDTLGLQPVKFPDYNTVYASLKTRQIDAWVAPSQQAVGTVKPGDATEIIENTFSLDNFVAYAVARENKPLIDALNSGLDAVIADAGQVVSAGQAVLLDVHGGVAVATATGGGVIGLELIPDRLGHAQLVGFVFLRSVEGADRLVIDILHGADLGPQIGGGITRNVAVGALGAGLLGGDEHLAEGQEAGDAALVENHQGTNVLLRHDRDRL